MLLVEDDSAVRLSFVMGLTHRQFKVLEAGDGEEALGICQSYNGVIDAVVVDIIMPRMWGHEFARRMALLRPRIPVLYISGHSEETLVSQGILTGGEPFLAKPFHAGILAKKLKQLLEKESASLLPDDRIVPAAEI